MNLNSLNLKIIIGAIYLAIISIGLYFLFSAVDLNDLMSYEFIKINKDVILKYKSENFLFLTIIFFIFCIVWVLLLGFAMPLLIFSGFVFGKWWGILIVLTSTTIGAVLLYLFAGFFFREAIKEKLAPKFSKLREFFNRNDIIYFMCFRFVGGGGIPYAVQNVLPILFNMPIKNYIIATEPGIIHQMKKNNPRKRFIPLPSNDGCACNKCPHMRLNTMEKIVDVLSTFFNQSLDY